MSLLIGQKKYQFTKQKYKHRRSDMQVGDLVQLSAAGKKLSSNWLLQDLVGVVVTVKTGSNPYKIHFPACRFRKEAWFKRYELKKVRKP